MKALIRRHTVSFRHALDGIRWAFSTQPNFRIHAAIATAVIAMGVFFRIQPLEWFVLLLTILLGLTGEMINTAIESMTDLITETWHVKAKIAKDVSAGMMLVIAIGAAAIGTAVFLPYIVAQVR